MALHRGRGRPRNDENELDPLAHTHIANCVSMGLIDADQQHAAEAYALLTLLVNGPPDGWVDPVPTRIRLAVLIEQKCPVMRGFAEDADKSFRLGKVPTSASRLLVAAAEAAMMSPLLKTLLAGGDPKFLDASRPGRAFNALQEFKRGLNRLCKAFEIPRRDTELMGEGP